MDRYQLIEINGVQAITKDGHTLFLEDVVKELNRGEAFRLQKEEAEHVIALLSDKNQTDLSVTLYDRSDNVFRGKPLVVGEHYDTWFKNKDGSGCKLLRIDPYTGIYTQDYNCVLVFECDRLTKPAEMAYQIKH